ncbi:class I SAM-dependent methyltransferase [Sporosarcina sp. CAU 1771]
MAKKLEFDVEIASEYDRGVRRTLPTYDQMLRISQTFLRANLKGDANLLVVGGGGGNELKAFGPTNLGWSFTAVDPSLEMLDVARRKMEQLEMEERVKLIHGTVKDVSEDALFDGATCILVLHFIPKVEDKLALLKKVRLHLKSGAPFVLVSMFGDPQDPEFQELVNLWRNYWLDTTNMSEEKVDELMQGTLMEASITEQKLRELLDDAGFHRVANFLRTNHFGGWICHAK